MDVKHGKTLRLLCYENMRGTLQIYDIA